MYDFFFVFQWLASNDTKSTIKSLQRLFKKSILTLDINSYSHL